jgi:hypothetical protein
MTNLSRDEMRLYQRARRARIKAEAECYPDGGTGAQVRAAGDRAAALVMAQGVKPPTPAPRIGLREMMTAAQPPATRSMFAVGGKAGRGLVAQGSGYPTSPDLAAVSPYTRAFEFERNATASINLLAREVAVLKREVATLKQEQAERPTFTNSLADGLLGLFVTIATANRQS